MSYRRQNHRDKNIYHLTQELRQSHKKNLARYAIWLALGAGIFLADIVVNGYWKVTTGHTMLECFILHPAGCDAPSMKIHGE